MTNPKRKPTPYPLDEGEYQICLAYVESQITAPCNAEHAAEGLD